MLYKDGKKRLQNLKPSGCVVGARKSIAPINVRSGRVTPPATEQLGHLTDGTTPENFALLSATDNSGGIQQSGLKEKTDTRSSTASANISLSWKNTSVA